MHSLNTATIEILSKCNFDCMHCYLDNKNNKSLTLNKWFISISNLNKLGITKLIITGGEPLLHPHFSEIYTYAYSYGMEVNIFTNGSLLSDKLISLFEIAPPKSISISIYGKDQEQYTKFTKVRSDILNKVMCNIKKLQEKNINVQLGITPYKNSVDDDWISFVNNNSININTYMIPNLRGKSNLSCRLTPNEMITVEQKLKQLRKVTTKPLTYSNTDYYKKCSGGISSIFVDPNGYVSMCAINRSDQLNILTDDFESIKNGLQKENQKIKDRYFKSPCGTCKHNAGCRNCPMYSELEGNKGGRNQYLCSLLIARESVLHL
ncbi:TPA: radical SAM protein [Vibrio alginolyticus]|nr:radical SAM protein [Vibrio alginolyticus]